VTIIASNLVCIVSLEKGMEKGEKGMEKNEIGFCPKSMNPDIMI
jgi:hypothetical protein